jgi:hypothetical protein
VLALQADPKRQHALSLDEWAELLWATWPEEYVEPPLPEKQELVLSREGRALTMAIRARAGCALRHPDDARDEYYDLLGRPVDSEGRADRAREGSEYVTQIVGPTPAEILRDWIEAFDDDWTSPQEM